MQSALDTTTPAPANWGLVFVHKCRSQACRDSDACELCMHNPNRKCTRNFCGKYLVDDVLCPKCNADIQVALIDTISGHPIHRNHAPELIECRATLLDGAAYDELETPTPEQAAITHNKEGNALLIQLPRTAHAALGHVAFQLRHGRGRLPDLTTTASSEAMLSGRKPPFRLWVRVQPAANQQAIADAVSEPFVVATRRVKSAAKLDTPLLDDPAGKLYNLGRETVRRLADLQAAAREFDVPLADDVPITHVHTVGDFLSLCRLADEDESLQQQLLSLVKLSGVKWQEARDHAATAVQRDDRPRVWALADDRPSLLYTCHRGQVNMDYPAALLLPAHHGAGAEAGLLPYAWQPVRRSAWDAQQRAMAESAHTQARSSWRRPGHVGWRALDGCDLAALRTWLGLEGAFRPASSRRGGLHSSGSTTPRSTATPATTPTPVTSAQSSPRSHMLLQDAMVSHASDVAMTLRGPSSKRASQSLPLEQVSKRRSSLTAEEIMGSPWMTAERPQMWSGSGGWSSSLTGGSSVGGSSGGPSFAAVHPLLAMPTRYAEFTRDEAHAPQATAAAAEPFGSTSTPPEVSLGSITLPSITLDEMLAVDEQQQAPAAAVLAGPPAMGGVPGASSPFAAFAFDSGWPRPTTPPQPMGGTPLGTPTSSTACLTPTHSAFLMASGQPGTRPPSPMLWQREVAKLTLDDLPFAATSEPPPASS